MIGNTTGIVVNIIESVSMNMPNSRKKQMITIIVCKGVPPSALITYRMACETTMNPRTKLKNTAASLISMIIDVDRMVPSKASFSI